MITNTLIEGLNEKILQAKVNKIDVKPFLFGTHFPVKKVNAFVWKTLTNQNGRNNVAADIVADNATIIRKKRPIFQSASGDLPKIAISRDLKRSEIKEYQVALALAGDPYAVELVQYWAEDVEFCFTGVQSELEYIAWALASNAGVLSFTNTNNAAVATEFDLDYQVDDVQKIKTTAPFSNKSTADVIGTVVDAVKQGKKNKANIKYGFMNLQTFYQVATCDQIIKNCASYVQNLTGTSQTPDLTAINAMLAKQAWCNGVEFKVIDQDITRELADGTETMGNPFADNRLIFSETPILGSTQYDILRDNSQVVMRAERSHTVVKKYSTPEPLVEVTLAEADALPVFDTAYKNIYVKTDATDW
ncbi:hypothetical protein LJC39_03305 [Parabacteroides sp. OttesenSCG-928-B22]|nr:hypothetical protein [Parabacteroides sp. OttesenSCG-928-B22]